MEQRRWNGNQVSYNTFIKAVANKRSDKAESKNGYAWGRQAATDRTDDIKSSSRYHVIYPRIGSMNDTTERRITGYIG
jgi:hypothetical protein